MNLLAQILHALFAMSTENYTAHVENDCKYDLTYRMCYIGRLLKFSAEKFAIYSPVCEYVLQTAGRDVVRMK